MRSYPRNPLIPNVANNSLVFIALSRFILNLRQADHYRTGQSISGQLEDIQFGYSSKIDRDSWVASFAGPMYCGIDDAFEGKDIEEDGSATASDFQLSDDIEARHLVENVSGDAIVVESRE